MGSAVKRKKVTATWVTAVLLVLLIGVGIWYFTEGTEPEGIQLVELAPEDVGLLQLENGKNGVYVEITDPEVIERVVKNLSEARFEKGESIPSSDGFRLSLFLIHRDGSTYRHLGGNRLLLFVWTGQRSSVIIRAERLE